MSLRFCPRFLFALLAVLVSARFAHGDLFHPISQATEGVVLIRNRSRPLFTLSLYYAQWENPFRYRLTLEDPDTGAVTTRDLRIVPETPATMVVEGSYHLGRRWHLGFWYNPIRDERVRENVRIADRVQPIRLERDADLANVSLTFLGPRGSTAQIGYYRERYALQNRVADLRECGAFSSWNFWVTQQLDIPFRRSTVTPFLSLGYYPSRDLNHAVSLLAGISLALHPQVDLAGSVWLFDLDNAATRLTGGVVYWF